MTALRPASRWYNTGYFGLNDHWFVLRKYMHNKNMSRIVHPVKNEADLLSNYTRGDDDYSQFDFVDSYKDISIQSSFLEASGGDTLGEWGFFDGIMGYPQIEVRHNWICNANGLRIYTSGYWRSAHFSRYTNNIRLLELTDS